MKHSIFTLCATTALAVLSLVRIFADTETSSVIFSFVVRDGEAHIENGHWEFDSDWEDGEDRYYVDGEDGYYVYDTAIPTSTSGAITIPSALDGYPVTSIGPHAFSGCSGLASVTIPDSVTSIGRHAFSGCSDALFDTHSIPGVRLVDGWAVGHEDGLSGALDLTGVRGIGYEAFSGCSGLASVTIPDSVMSIGSSAFSGCSGLKSVTIPDSVTSIGGGAFEGCSGLTSVTIGNSVTSIGYEAFSGCSGLASVAIPASVTSIWDEAFRDCSGLASVTIPDSVTSIGRWAFSGCSGLASVTIGNGVTNIGEYAFSECNSLTEVTVGGDVNLANNAFPSSLRTLTFLGNSPVLSSDTMLSGALPNCTVYAKPGSTGWRTTIPGWWRELPIRYLSGTTPPSPGSPGTPGTPTGSSTYTVKFDANGGKGSMAAQTMTWDTAAKLRKNTFTRSDRVFAGWSLTKGGAVAYGNAALVKDLPADGGTITLYAKWAKKSYKVKFYANGGKGKMDTLAMTYGKAKKLPKNKFTRSGYKFQGWATSKSKAKKGTVAYKNKKKVKNLTTTGKTVKLYAVWKSR